MLFKIVNSLHLIVKSPAFISTLFYSPLEKLLGYYRKSHKTAQNIKKIQLLTIVNRLHLIGKSPVFIITLFALPLERLLGYYRKSHKIVEFQFSSYSMLSKNALQIIQDYYYTLEIESTINELSPIQMVQIKTRDCGLRCNVESSNRCLKSGTKYFMDI